MAEVCLFDVNETLLDLTALDAGFQRVFGEAGVHREWFAQLLESALTSTIVGAYRELGEIGRAALQMTAMRRGTTLDDEDAAGILSGFHRLPAHPDVRPALEQLQEAGFRLATLSNGTVMAQEAQLAHAGIADLFELVLSADSVRRLKPAPEPYRMAVSELNTEPGDIWFIAAHPWDIAGASNAGLRTAFVGRPGKVPDPAFPPPSITGVSLHKVADQIIAAEQQW